MSDERTPIRIKIPSPSYIETAHGIDSTYGPCGRRPQFRCLVHEQEAIQQAAEKLGITPSNFMRWITYFAATAIINPTEDNSDFV